MAKKRANLSDLLNNLTFKTLYEKYKLMAINAFEWDGLPEGIEEKHIEKYLYKHGKAVFFRDPQMSFMCLECQDGYKLDVHGECLNYNAIGFGYNKTYHRDDCVVIDNNKLRLATDPFIMFYVNKLTEAERTMDVNVKAVKTPYIFGCDDKDILTAKRIFQQIDGNVPALFVDKGLNLESFTVLQTGVKFMGNELMDYKTSIENELLTFLGINNIPTDKKERLITDEANSNNQLIESFAELQLEARQRACDDINKKYGLHISVKRRCGNVENNVEGVEKNVDDTDNV